MKKHLLGILVVIFVFGCNEKQSNWTSESLDKKHVTWNGSYENAEKLKVINHGVKFYHEKDIYEWAFKVKVVYPKNNDEAKTKGTFKIPSNAEICMPITKIKYSIYDNDDFLIDSISLTGECLTHSDTIIFQSKKRISEELKKKFKYGKVNIEAGNRTEL